MVTPYRASDDIVVLPIYEPAGEFGFLPITAYLIEGSEPILVDTGLAGTGDEFMTALRSVIDPAELRWILFTHEDRDHSGNLAMLVDEAPNSTVVMNFLGMLKLGHDVLMPVDRVYFVNPGQSFDAGDRSFQVMRPPLFDSAASIGFYDETDDALFTVDSFGALIPRPADGPDDIIEGFDEGFVFFNHANHAWIGLVDRDRYEAAIDESVRAFEPRLLLPAHAPALIDRTDEMVERLAALPSIEPMEMPDDAAFRVMLERLKSGGRPPGAEGVGEAA